MNRRSESWGIPLCVCPFCGCRGEIVFADFDDGSMYGVCCVSALCIANDIIPSFESSKVAADAWNRRKL